MKLIVIVYIYELLTKHYACALNTIPVLLTGIVTKSSNDFRLLILLLLTFNSWEEKVYRD